MHFEKQNDTNTWVQYVRGELWRNFTQIALNTDVNGFPVALLGAPENGLTIKLVQNISFFWANNLNSSVLSRGHWATNEGRN